METSFFDSLEFDDVLHNLINDDDWTSAGSISNFENSSCSGTTSSTTEYYNTEYENTSPTSNIIIFDRCNEQCKKKIKPHHAVRHDIRRSYAEMFTNVINSMDFRLLYGFMDTYFSHSVFQDNSRYSLTTKENLKSSLDGIVSVAKYWYNSTTPDAVCSLSDTKIYTSSDPRNNRVVSTYSYSGTNMYDRTAPLVHITVPKITYGCGYDDEGHTSDEDSLSTTSGSDSSGVEDGESSLSAVGEKRKKPLLFPSNKNNQQPHLHVNQLSFMDRLIESIHTASAALPLLDTPLRVDALGRMVMHTDENNFITKIVFEKTYMETAVRQPLGSGFHSVV
jgi:hypothetical protein